ncbi:MAG: hypothetical protein WBV80_27175 [Mycobacterium sp.]
MSWITSATSWALTGAIDHGCVPQAAKLPALAVGAVVVAIIAGVTGCTINEAPAPTATVTATPTPVYSAEEQEALDALKPVCNAVMIRRPCMRVQRRHLT